MDDHPKLQAIVLADRIYTEQHTGKKIIAGTFNTLSSPEFPCDYHTTTFAYICATNVRGRAPMHLRYVDLKTNEILFRSGQFELSSKDPLASIELIVEVPPFPMPHPGVFVFEVVSREEPIGSYRILVNKREKAKG